MLSCFGVFEPTLTSSVSLSLAMAMAESMHKLKHLVVPHISPPEGNN
jgi:hypothetical protein